MKRRQINSMQVKKAALTKKVDEMKQEVIEKERKIARLNVASNALSILTNEIEESTANVNLKCRVCGLSFGSRQELDRHKRQHNNERAHSCPLCLKRFGKLGVFKHHLVVCAEREKMNNGGYYCDCGEALIKCAAQNAYNSATFITCDACGKRRRGNTTIYHCQKGRCRDHENGFDKCMSCVRKM